MPSIRHITRTLLAVLITTLPAIAQGQSSGNVAQDADVNPGLGLLFSAEDIPRIRANAEHPYFADYWQSQLELDFSADNNFFREAFIYVVTGDRARGASAKRAVLAMTEEEYWNDFVDGEERLGFLKAGRITAWMSLAYDWLYEMLSESEREKIRTAIAEKGCIPLYRSLYGFKYPDTVTGWSFASYAPRTPRYDLDMSRWPEILAKNNFRAIINGGLTLGSIVLDGYDERAEEWQEMVLESIVLTNELLKDDGSYDEAVAYLNYAMTYQQHAMEGARRKLGADFFDTANFQGMMDYVLAMYLPTDLYGHGSITFGDAGNSLQSQVSLWVASEARDGLSQYIALNLSDHHPLSLLYFDPTVEAEPPSTSSHFTELDLDWIISRSGYDRDDFVVAMRSGEPMNHEHGDRNSIQLKSDGEILLADHRRLTYWALEPEWEWRGSAGHNMLLINGMGVQYHNGEEGTNESKSYAKIVRAGERDGYHFWASDATQGYQLLNPAVESVTRSVISFPDLATAIVIDKAMTTSSASEFTMRWHVENADGLGGAAAHDAGFVIERPSARLAASFGGSASLVAAADSFKTQNKEYPFRYVDVTTEGTSETFLGITTLAAVQSSSPDPVVSILNSAAADASPVWTVRIERDGFVVVVDIDDNGTVPEFMVR